MKESGQCGERDMQYDNENTTGQTNNIICYNLCVFSAPIHVPNFQHCPDSFNVFSRQYIYIGYTLSDPCNNCKPWNKYGKM